jgi:hypothetical protein
VEHGGEVGPVAGRPDLRRRRGAWYRIARLDPLQAVVEVRAGRSLEVPAAFLQVIDNPPRHWSIVPRPSDAVRVPAHRGDRYAVCPSCNGRQPVSGRPRRLSCQRCRSEFAVAWTAI